MVKTHTKKIKKITLKNDSSITIPKFCAPYVKSRTTISNRHIRSCLSRPALIRLVKTWNSNNPLDKIKSKGASNSLLWMALNKRMRSSCGNGKEYCWLSQQPLKTLKGTKELDVYKPDMPKEWYNNPDEWLNTLDIQAIMKQYEQTYKRFKFIGPVPMDFDSKLSFGHCVVDELCNLDMARLYKSGIKQLGIIFNLDKHNQSGSHWVALFCCLDRCGVYYWDSYGMEPSPEVLELMNRLKAKCESMGYKIEPKINKIRHQYKNSECGVYCLHFIIQLLKGKSFDHITKNIISDDQMLEYRNILYNKLPETPK
jgi:hypothetical protein